MMSFKNFLTRILVTRTKCAAAPQFICFLALLAAPTVRLSASDLGSVILNRDGIALHSPQSELVYEGMASYGNYRLFGAAENAKLYSAGVEYDRELWPRFLRARVDYVSEILPVLLLSQPVRTDFWGDTLSSDRKIVPGMGISPLGFRLLWRDGRRWMPYFETKGSVLGFTQKALSSDATYENWSFHLTGGIKLKLHGHYDLRLGMLSDMHFSNAFVVRSNPALDVMNANVGIVYHLGGPGTSR
jgi:Lipid A 3-O-deacylase (PagL)